MNTPMKTLYVSDMDGTLLGNDSKVSATSAALISDLTRRGALITVATARTPATVVPLLAGIDTAAEAVVMTGAAVWNRPGSEYTNVRFMAPALVAEALDICRAVDIHPFVYTLRPGEPMLDVYHAASAMNKPEENFYLERARLKLKRFHGSTPLPEHAARNTILFFGMGWRSNIEEAARVIAARLDCSVCCYPDIFNPEVANIEVFAPGVSKATAILELKERLGADRLVVFGDNLNDIPMLGVADVAVAVENAFPQVKEIADVVIGPNFTDSVAKFIAHDFDR